jgi:hypothetical protein
MAGRRRTPCDLEVASDDLLNAAASVTPDGYSPQDRHEASPGDQNACAIDVTTLNATWRRPCIVEGLWPVRSILGIAGEEGDGKTLLAEQLLRQILRGDRPLEFFELGEEQVRRVLFIDTEMEREDAAERNAEMVRRGLGVAPDQFYWYSPGGLVLNDRRDLDNIRKEIWSRRPDIVWIDSATNAVSDAEEGAEVKELFNNLSFLTRAHDLLGIGLTFHTRKRAQGRDARRFDDLFGSREWKGRVGTLLYIEGNRVTSWKNRGGRLARLWGAENGKPYATLNRPGLTEEDSAPFTVSEPTTADVAAEEYALRAAVIDVLTAEPDVYNKTGLARRVGRRKGEALHFISRLQELGGIIPKEKGAKLRLDLGALELLGIIPLSPDSESSRDGSL